MSASLGPSCSRSDFSSESRSLSARPSARQALAAATQVAGLPSHTRPAQQSLKSAQPPPEFTHAAVHSEPSPPATQAPRQQSPPAVQRAPLARHGPGPSSQRSLTHTPEQQGSPPPLVQLSPVARQIVASSCWHLAPTQRPLQHCAGEPQSSSTRLQAS